MEGGWHEVPQTRSGGVLIRKKIKTAMFSLARHRANIYLHCLNFLSAMIFSQIRFTAGETRSEFHQEQPQVCGVLGGPGWVPRMLDSSEQVSGEVASQSRPALAFGPRRGGKSLPNQHLLILDTTAVPQVGTGLDQEGTISVPDQEGTIPVPDQEGTIQGLAATAELSVRPQHPSICPDPGCSPQPQVGPCCGNRDAGFRETEVSPPPTSGERRGHVKKREKLTKAQALAWGPPAGPGLPGQTGSS